MIRASRARLPMSINRSLFRSYYGAHECRLSGCWARPKRLVLCHSLIEGFGGTVWRSQAVVFRSLHGLTRR